MTVVFTPRSADRISRITQWAEKEIGLDRDSPGSAMPADAVYVLTTSGTATSGLYPGKVVLYDANADTWREFGTVKLKPANSETLSNATRYAARYTGRTSGGDDVFTVLQGGGGITVEEQDGSPSYTGITKIVCDQSDGFVVSNPATGVARIDISAATTTQAGIVTTSGQIIAGTKQFIDGITLGYTSSVSPSDPIPFGKIYATISDDNVLPGAYSGYVFIGEGKTESSVVLSGRSFYQYSNTYYSYDTGFEIEPNAVFPKIIIMGRTFTRYYGEVGWPRVEDRNPELYVRVNSTDRQGQYGILKSNAQVSAGIITNLGNTSVQSSSWMGF